MPLSQLVRMQRASCSDAGANAQTILQFEYVFAPVRLWPCKGPLAEQAKGRGIDAALAAFLCYFQYFELIPSPVMITTVL